MMMSTKGFSSANKSSVPASGVDFNHLTGEGDSLLKMMKERGSNIYVMQST